MYEIILEVSPRGDSVSYLVGRQGAFFVPRFLQELFNRVYKFAVGHPRSFLIICFLYGSLSPFPNDLITIPAGIARIPYVCVMVPLALGNVVFNVTLSCFAFYVYDAIRALTAA